MPKAKSCRCCGTKKKCSGAHVYAIELKSEVTADPKFRKVAGIGEDFTGRCFYVGQTRSHSVECRFKQHRAKKRTRTSNITGVMRGMYLSVNTQKGWPMNYSPISIHYLKRLIP